MTYEKYPLTLDQEGVALRYLSSPSPGVRSPVISRRREKQARAHPDAVAVVFGTHQLTYAQLNARANQLARYLVGRASVRMDGWHCARSAARRRWWPSSPRSRRAEPACWSQQAHTAALESRRHKFRPSPCPMHQSMPRRLRRPAPVADRPGWPAWSGAGRTRPRPAACARPRRPGGRSR